MISVFENYMETRSP